MQVSKLDVPRASSVYPDDSISPPESPRYHPSTQEVPRSDSPDISPIDEGPDASDTHLQTLPTYRSHIQTSNSCQKSKDRGIAYTDPRSKNDNYDSLGKASVITRWDDFSGEPTTNEKGKPAQVIPGSSGFDAVTHRLFDSAAVGNPLSIVGRGSPNSMKAPFQPETPVDQCKWPGSHAKPTSIRPSVNKPLPPTKPPESTRESTAELRFANQQNGMRSKQHLQYGRTCGIKDSDDIIKPIVPLKIGRKCSPSTITPPASGKAQHLVPNATTQLDKRSPLGRNPSREQLANRSPYIEDLPCNIGRTMSSGSTEQAFQHLRLPSPRHEVSRFSTTTYATTVPESPPSTPLLESESPSEAETPSSILNRRRPIRVAGVPIAKGTARKPTSSDLQALSLLDAQDIRNSKSLPQSPPEIAAIDRVAGLQAKIDNLYRRKANLKTVIHELTHVIQPSSIAYDTASRQEIKKTVDGLNKELDEVTKEEYDTGLRLHRASKRQDNNDSIYEPTGLWVRRVTT